MSLKFVICFIVLLTTVSSVDENSIAPNVEENIKKEPVPIVCHGDNCDVKNDAIVKKKLPGDIIKEVLNKTLVAINDVGEKWKAWQKHLKCSKVTSKFMKCNTNKLFNLNNPDKWKATISKTPIPDEPTPRTEEEPETIKGSLRDWLYQNKKFLIKAQNKTNTSGNSVPTDVK